MKSANELTMPPNVSQDQNTDGGNFSSEDDFRGFEKVPIVLCERFDIAKFLNCSHQHYFKSKRNHESTNHNSKLLSDCKVVLVRDDLDYLLKVFKGHSKDSVLFFDHNEKTFKCQICFKVYSSEKRLQNHQEKKHIMMVCQPNVVKNQKRVSFSDHVIVHEVKEYHRCRKCPKIFEDYKSLKTHMKRIHRKRKCYICFYCSKDFVDRMFFKVHVRLHCDRCGKLLENKKEFADHRRNVCKVIKKYECKNCKELYFSFMGLKDHSYQHEGLVFVCDICRDRFDTLSGIEHHIKCLHTVKRPNALYHMTELGENMLYECNFCEKRFLQQEELDKHVLLLPDLLNRKTTSYKDYYFCDNCSEQFVTETDMLQHKWTHFLKNTTSECKNKEISKFKRFYKVGEELPMFLQPKVVLEKLALPETVTASNNKPVEIIDLTNPMDANTQTMLPYAKNMSLKKAIVDPASKKTLLSRHQCDKCGKYYSTNYCLTRHKHTKHGIGGYVDYDDLHCSVCEENFSNPSLLLSHTCIRMTIPEMPFDDARPEVHFDNINNYKQNAMEDEYMNPMDFDITAPIVQLTEYDNFNIVVNGGSGHVNLVQSDNVNVKAMHSESVHVNLVHSGNGLSNLEHTANGHANLVYSENGPANLVQNSNGHVNLVNTVKIVDPIQNFAYNVIMQEVPIEF